MDGTLPQLDWTSTDAWIDAGRTAGFVIAGYAALLWLAVVVWTYRDIASRSSSIWVRAFYVLFVTAFFIPGLLVYLALRPHELMSDVYNRKLEAEAFRQEIEKYPTCDACRRSVREDFIMCPYCRATLRTACMECGAYLASSWVACPYCASDRQYAAYGIVTGRSNGSNGNGTPPRRPASVDRRPRSIRPQTTHS